MSLSKIRRLTWEERRLLAAAFVLLPLAHLTLRVTSFARCKTLLRLVPKGRGSSDPASRDRVARLSTYAVRVTASRTLFRPTCLPQSLVLWYLLRRRGVETTIRIGVRKTEARVEGHAWVELDGVALNDDIDVHERFAAFERAVSDHMTAADPLTLRLPDAPVLRMDRHDGAYYAWRDAGMRNRVLVHVDAHHDMWWFDRQAALSIANFICAAIRENLVSRVFWIVPDAAWENERARGAVHRHLQRLTARYPGSDAGVRVASDAISTTLMGKPITACTLGSLPALDGPVLLDIDVDFMMIPVVSFEEADVVKAVPWLWSGQLVDRLAATGLRSDLITIASSVDGGYTPLKWKYLGDEVAARLGASSLPISGFDALREGALAANRGDNVAALASFERAAAALPELPAPHHHLALGYLAMGRTDDARREYLRAAASDPAYQAPYNNDGLSLYQAGLYSEAEREWKSALELDSEDAFSHLGLARIALRREDWTGAVSHTDSALKIDNRLVDGHRLAARAFTAQGKPDAAMASYERSLRLTYEGQRSIAVEPASNVDGRHIDPDHFQVFARLGRLYSATGNRRSAIENYRMALAAKCDSPRLRIELARLYLAEGLVARGLRELWSALRTAIRLRSQPTTA